MTSKKEMLKALEKTLGIVSHACNMVNISRETHYRWIRNDEKYKQLVADIEEKAIDFAESKLHQLIAGVKLLETKVFVVDAKEGKEILTHEMTRHFAPDTAATIFYLKTKGRSRGYIERQEIAQTNTKGEDVAPTIILKQYMGEPIEIKENE